MIFGFDIDDTISDFTKELIKHAVKYDKKLRNTGIVNKDKYIYKGMFDWNEEETTNFERKYVQLAAGKMKPKKGITELMNKLKNEGNTIKLISARATNHYSNPYEITLEWLNKNNILFDKLIVQASDKVKVCEEENIDVYIDDIYSICEKVSNTGIKCYIFDSMFNKKYYNENIKRIKKWKNFYREIEMEKFYE